ncbi:MAG: ATP-binding cassette domain-containing protein, partial [Rhodospirillaceae bacterium]|nr:ATP-binding cassette domain-containing protein [Rhodospirillaceae bacterium]
MADHGRFIGRRGRGCMAAMVSGGDGAPLLVTRGLTKSFSGLVALKDHAIIVQPGEIVGIIGPNGSGKSTFFNLVTGFLRPTAGTVLFCGTALERLRPSAIARLGVARTFQGTRLFARLTARENLQAAAQLRHEVGLADALLGTPRSARARIAVDAVSDELLDLVGLAASAGRRAGDLPYGDQRRLELARA